MEILKYILSSLVVVITPIIFTKITLNLKKRNNKLKIILIIVFTIIIDIVIYKYTTGIYKSILNYLTCLLVIHETYKISIKNSIMISVIFMIVLMIPEAIVIYTTINIIGMPIEECYNSFAGSVLGNIVILFILIPLSLIIRKPIKKLMDIKIKLNYKVVIFSVLTLISTLVFFYDIIASFRVGAKIIFYIIAIITFVSALVIVVYQENKNAILRIEYNKLLEFMETYEIELEEQRILKHEYRNQLITIKSKIIDKDKKSKIIDYIDSLLGDEKKFSQEAYTKLQYLPPNGTKALFYFKIAEANNKGIKTSVNISQSIKESNLINLTTKEFKDLGVLIGVYLDNAIEASAQSENKLLGIEMYKTEEGIVMIISNSYKGIIDEEKLGKLPFSTKGKGRGYGLMLVKNTIINNKIFEISTEVTSNLYIQTINIKKVLCQAVGVTQKFDKKIC